MSFDGQALTTAVARCGSGLRAACSRISVAQLLIGFLVLLLLSGCSSTNRNDPNPVGQYDREFNDPGRDKKRRKAEGNLLPNLDAELELFEEATDAYDRGLYTLAKDNFTRLLERYPASYYAPFAELKIADCLYYLNDLPAALTAYEEFLRVHPTHEAVPYIHFQIGNTFRLQYKGPTQDQAPLHSAIKRYKQMLEQYPQSEYAPLARRYIHHSREQLANHDALVADFYFKQGALQASAARYREVLLSYPESDTAKQIYSRLPELFGNNPSLLRKTRSPVPRVAAPSVELTPDSPVIAAAGRGKARLRSPASRYRNLQQAKQLEAEQTEVIPPRKDAPISLTTETDGPLAQRLECEQIGELSVFSLQIRDDASVANPRRYEGEHANRMEMELAPSPRRVESALLDTPLDCEAGGVEFSINEADEQLEIAVHYPEKKTVRYFLLDRPFRLITIVQPDDSTSGALSRGRRTGRES